MTLAPYCPICGRRHPQVDHGVQEYPDIIWSRWEHPDWHCLGQPAIDLLSLLVGVTREHGPRNDGLYALYLEVMKSEIERLELIYKQHRQLLEEKWHVQRDELNRRTQRMLQREGEETA